MISTPHSERWFQSGFLSWSRVNAINTCLPPNTFILIETCITDLGIRLIFSLWPSCLAIWKKSVICLVLFDFNISSFSLLIFPALLRYNWYQWSIWTFHVAQEEWASSRFFFTGATNVLVQKREFFQHFLALYSHLCPPNLGEYGTKALLLLAIHVHCPLCSELLYGAWCACVVHPYL